MKLTNFKGIRNLEISFTNETNIYGDNGTGKTSICDAFTWLLFGKDSKDRKDFEIKTLDDNNKVIPEIDHEVEAELNVDGQTITLKKILRENWVKKRGSTTTELAGNETLCYWNDVPMKVGEFQSKVSSLVDESLFKLLTNPLFFNTNLKWQDRRTVLFSLADKVYDADILDKIATVSNKDQIGNLTNLLNQGKTITEIKKEYAAKKKKIKDELDTIPTRIDEANRSLPEVIDYSAIENQIKDYESQIAQWSGEKENVVKASQAANKAIMDKQKELNDMKLRLQNLRYQLTSGHSQQRQQVEGKLNLIKNEIDQLKRINANYQSNISSSEASIVNLEAANAQLREQWMAVNSRTFEVSDDKTICPACKQKLPDTEIANITEKLTANFNRQKQIELQSIDDLGKSNKARIEEHRQSIANCEQQITGNAATITERTDELENLNNQLQYLVSNPPLDTDEIKQLELEISNFIIPEGTQLDFSELNQKITQAQNCIGDLKMKLYSKQQRETTIARIKDLQELEGNYAQQLADLEATEFVVEAFNKTKTDALVDSVNRKFSTIKFKLFESQINGGEVETCEALVNTNGAWVPFSGANTAGQINAGIDVINTLCAHHNAYAPIFIDNRETVNHLIPSQSQIINLIVSNDKTLKIH